jgi:hypothetical protein
MTRRMFVSSHDRLAEGDRRDRPRGVGADAGQAGQLVDVAGPLSVVPLDDDDRRLAKAHGPAVVTESLPGPDRITHRETSHERAPVPLDPLRLRLLEHHLRDEHRPRVPCLANANMRPSGRCQARRRLSSVVAIRPSVAAALAPLSRR